MIYVDNPTIERTEVEQLLADTRVGTLNTIATFGHPERVTGNEFEEIVYEVAKSYARGTNFEGQIVHTADREFPDIVAADRYGIEVKQPKRTTGLQLVIAFWNHLAFPQSKRFICFLAN